MKEKNKKLFYEINDRTLEEENLDLLSVSEYYGVGLRKEKKEEEDFLSRAETLDGYKKCNKFDIVMNIMLAWKRAIGVSRYDGIVSPAYCVYRKRSDKVNTNYYHYLFRTDLYADLFRRYSTGIIDSRLRLYPDKFFSLFSHFPPLLEQQAIADYLDRKSELIDSMIEKQKMVIEKLKLYKQSIITEAVTKGLDPSVTMKPSGIEWIGDIPESWKVTKISRIFKFLGGFAFKSEKYVSESNNQIIRLGNVKNDLLLVDSKEVFISDEYARKASGFQIKLNDILFTMTGTKGKRDYFYTLIVKDSDLTGRKLFINQRVGCFRKINDIYPKYYDYLLKNDRILDSIFFFETGTANQGNLGIETIQQTKLQFAPLSEQQAIADYLDQKCTQIDNIIEQKQNLIEKLSNYKKSLIYECVTGKREVSPNA